MDWIEMISGLGFPIVCVIAMAVFFKYLIDRVLNQNEKREEVQNQQIEKQSEALAKITLTIEESNKINQELTETNKMLVEKMEVKLNSIDSKIDKIIDKGE